MSDSHDEADPDDLRAAKISARGKAGEGISNDDMLFLMQHAAKRGQHMTYLGVAPRQGISDLSVATGNQKILRARLRVALEQQFYLEAISAQVLLLELVLREWLEVWRRRQWEAKERQTFGQLVQEAKNKGFDAALSTRLETFNRSRNDAIHGLLRKAQVYPDLGKIFSEDPNLLDDVTTAVEAARPKLGEVGFGPNGELYDSDGHLLN